MFIFCQFPAQRLRLPAGWRALGAVGAALALGACSPAFNWREVRLENTRLSLLLPCKPELAQKTVPMAGQSTQLRLVGCDAGGATFAVAVADLGSATQSALVLGQWQSLTLANMKAPGAAGAAPAAPLKVPGAALQPPAVRVAATGQRADGTAVKGQAAYFAQGSQVFQAVIYAADIKPEVSDAFFSSLKFD